MEINSITLKTALTALHLEEARIRQSVPSAGATQECAACPPQRCGAGWAGAAPPLDDTSDSRSRRRSCMADRECVLRFLAFTITPYTEYTNIKPNGFDNFLNDSMAKINKMEMSDLENLERRFLRAMQAALDIFGKDAFRKLYKVDGRRNPINKALFESWSVNLNLLDDNQIKSLIKKKHILNNKFIKLMNKSTFNDAISQATGNSSKVKLRFSEIETLIKEVLS